MNYDDKWPNPDTSLEYFHRGDILFFCPRPQAEKCFMCGARTHWYSIYFEAPVCSEECDDKAWEEMYSSAEAVEATGNG